MRSLPSAEAALQMRHRSAASDSGITATTCLSQRLGACSLRPHDQAEYRGGEPHWVSQTTPTSAPWSGPALHLNANFAASQHRTLLLFTIRTRLFADTESLRNRLCANFVLVHRWTSTTPGPELASASHTATPRSSRRTVRYHRTSVLATGYQTAITAPIHGLMNEGPAAAASSGREVPLFVF